MLRMDGLSARRLASAGFTLIELVVVLGIVGVSARLAAPAMSQMMANYRVRNTAESLLNGLQLARAEAVRRNSSVAFLLQGASGWEVKQLPSTSLQSVTANSAGTTVTPSTTATSVTFLATGMVQSAGLSAITVSSAIPGTKTRKINIFGGGLIRMCDPGVTDTNDARRC